MKKSDVEYLIKEYYRQKHGESVFGFFGYHMGVDSEEISALKKFLDKYKILTPDTKLEAEHIKQLVQILSSYEDKRTQTAAAKDPDKTTPAIIEHLFTLIKNSLVESHFEKMEPGDLSRIAMIPGLHNTQNFEFLPEVIAVLFKNEKNKLLQSLRSSALKSDTQSILLLGTILITGQYENKKIQELISEAAAAPLISRVPSELDFQPVPTQTVIGNFKQNEDNMLVVATLNMKPELLSTKLTIQNMKIPADPVEGMRWLNEAHDKGVNEASMLLATYYAGGIVEDALDNAKAEEYLSAAAQRGWTTAQRVLEGDIQFYHYTPTQKILEI